MSVANQFFNKLNLPAIFLNRWSIFVYIFYFLILSGVLIYGIGIGQTLPGYSQAEAEVLKTTSSFPDVFENFLYWPYYLGVYLLRFIVSDGVLAARLVSALSALIASVSFLIILRHKFDPFISLAGVSLFALNSWVLQLARIGTGEMSGLAFLFVLATTLIVMNRFSHDFRIKLLALICAILSWFTPLAPWLITGLFIHIFYRHRVLARFLSLRLKWSLIITFITLCCLMFLSYGVNQQNVFLSWGIPENIESFQSVLMNFWQSLVAIFWKAPENPSHWLSNLPFLDIFAASMISFGVYAGYSQRSKINYRYLICCILGLLAIASFNQGLKTVGINLILPIIILAVTAGLHEFIDYWRKIFPLNPLAKILNITLILILMSLSLFYQVNRYFVAWSQSPQTQEIYNLKDSK